MLNILFLNRSFVYVILTLFGCVLGSGVLTGQEARTGDSPEDRAVKAVEEVGGSIVKGKNQKGDTTCTVTVAGSELPATFLEELSHLRALREVRANRATFADTRLKGLSMIHDLEVLNLSNSNVGDEGMQAISECKRLRMLWLYGTQVSDAGIVRLSTLRHLETICLGDTKINGKSLRGLTALPRLKELDISYCVLSQDGFQEVSRAKTLLRLN